MTEPSRNSPNPPRQPYQKPALVQVKLIVEEAVFTSCKTGTMSGPGGAGCKNVPRGNCQGLGGS